MPGFPVPHHLLEFAQAHIHWPGDAIQPSHPLSPSSPSAFNLSQEQDFPPVSQLFALGGQFTLIHVLNIPGSYAILFFIVVEFTFITRHIHNQESCLLGPSCFLLSGVVSICPLLFCSNMLDTFRPEGLIFYCHIFCLFMQFMGFSWLASWSGLPFCPPIDHVLSELSSVTRPSWWSNMAWLIASLNYASLFAMTRQGSMKGEGNSKDI